MYIFYNPLRWGGYLWQPPKNLGCHLEYLIPGHSLLIKRFILLWHLISGQNSIFFPSETASKHTVFFLVRLECRKETKTFELCSFSFCFIYLSVEMINRDITNVYSDL